MFGTEGTTVMGGATTVIVEPTVELRVIDSLAADITDWAAAVVPPGVCGGVKLTTGGEVQPEPGLFTTICKTWPGLTVLITTVAVGSVVQPPGPKVMVGAEV